MGQKDKLIAKLKSNPRNFTFEEALVISVIIEIIKVKPVVPG